MISFGGEPVRENIEVKICKYEDNRIVPGTNVKVCILNPRNHLISQYNPPKHQYTFFKVFSIHSISGRYHIFICDVFQPVFFLIVESWKSHNMRRVIINTSTWPPQLEVYEEVPCNSNEIVLFSINQVFSYGILIQCVGKICLVCSGLSLTVYNS